MPAVPSGTVTFLFTDIEGSTTRWEQQPDAMRAALARHDVLLHEGITAHGGVVMIERGEGDSFFALFARPSDALAAACTVQRALTAEPWPLEVAPLRVRMALHTGEAGLWEGRDYRGAAVNRCARLRAVAHGGQILLSGATQHLVRDLLPDGVSIRDLGEHRLKDLTHPEHIYQVLIPGLPTSFPPLKTLNIHRHNLPVQLTPFIGREREVVTVRERLLELHTRLLTLTGPGGTGKTRLALRIAAETVDAFPDGVFFVALAPINDPDLLLATIAQALGLKEAGGHSLANMLTEELREQEVLLVLDNFEQVLAAAARVGELLAACPRLRVLVTSRAALHVRGEREYPVAPLAVPDLQAHPSIQTLTQYDAVRLFMDRAQDIRPDFTLTNRTAQAVTEICAQLDGLPLAIELAAARVKILPPEALLARLEHRLQVLVGGARDLPERQQTLRNAIAWSYDLLNAGEQTLFRRLAVFVDSWTLEAAERVCADGVLGTDVLGGLASLVDNSLVQQKDLMDGASHFSMLQTIREYGLEQLAASGEEAALRQRHATYYLALAEPAEHVLQGSDQAIWLARLAAEHDNLRAALAWILDRGDAESGWRLGAALWRFWLLHGNLSEGRAWLEQLLAIAPTGGQGERYYAMATNGASALAATQGDYRRAADLLDESFRLFQALGDTMGQAAARNNRGNVAWEQGDFEQAQILYKESLTLYQELGDTLKIATTTGNLGLLLAHRGDYEQAVTLLEKSLAMLQGMGNRWGTANALNGLGFVARRQGAYERALALHMESLTVRRDLSDPEVAESLEGIAEAVHGLGQGELAARIYGTAASIRSILGAPIRPADRVAHDRIEGAIYAALGQDAFTREWVAGQNMSLDQAIADVQTLLQSPQSSA